MRINLVKIGNSRGLRLPKAVIESCGIETSVNLEIRGRELIIRPTESPRAHWEDALVKNPDVETWTEWESLSPSSDDEWTWPEDQKWPNTLLVSKSG